MNNWLKRIGLDKVLGSNRDNSPVKFSRQTIHDAIDSVVAGTEPKIRFLPTYKKLLEKPVTTSLTYIDELVERIPGPIIVSSKQFSADANVHAYFASTKDIQTIFSNSPELKAFFDAISNIESEQSYALLCMSRAEKTVLGMDLQDDMLRRDVLQTAVNFSEHKVMSPAATEEDVRKGIKKCIFDGLITNALQKLLELKTQQQGLQEQQCILQSRLRSRQSQGGGLTSLIASAQPVDSQCEVILEQIADTEEKLKSMPPQWELPRHYLDTIKEIFEQPSEFIRLKDISVNISKMGIKVSDASNQDASLIHFHELTIANVLKRVVAIVTYPRNEMHPTEKLF